MRLRDAVLATFSVFGAFSAAAVLAQAPDASAELLGNWDRATLYALRGVLAVGDVGEVERGMQYLTYYSKRPARTPLTAATIHTLARLPAGTAQARMTGVHILGGLIDVAHRGHRHTTFRNRSDKPLRWQAEFAGALEQVWVHTEPIRPRVRQSWDAKPISFVLVTVEPGSEITVRAP